MCLTTVNGKFKPPQKGVKIGWKLVEVHNEDAFLNIFRYFARRVIIPINRWYEDPNDGKLKAEDGQKYTTGFHIYQNEERAKAWEKALIGMWIKLVKVEYDDTVAEGLETKTLIGESIGVVVARKIRILEICA